MERWFRGDILILDSHLSQGFKFQALPQKKKTKPQLNKPSKSNEEGDWEDWLCPPSRGWCSICARTDFEADVEKATKQGRISKIGRVMENSITWWLEAMTDVSLSKWESCCYVVVQYHRPYLGQRQVLTPAATAAIAKGKKASAEKIIRKHLPAR